MNNTLLAGVLILIGAGVYVSMKISQGGIDRLKRHEALYGEPNLTPYRDQAGHWTIGYGHKLKEGEWYERITPEKAEQLLIADLAVAERAVNDYVTVPITQSQHDALVSFVYNVGVSAFRNSTLLQKLNAGDYAGAANEFPKWKYVTQDGQKVISEGLLSRRYRERDLFMA